MIANCKTLPDTYKIVRWHYAAPGYQLPPLYDYDLGEKVSDPLSKAKILHKKLPCRHIDTEDIPLNTATIPRHDILLVDISTSEAYKATCQVTSTTADQDELTSCKFRTAWPVFSDRITNLHQEVI